MQQESEAQYLPLRCSGGEATVEYKGKTQKLII